jgi:hypothetical protein
MPSAPIIDASVTMRPMAVPQPFCSACAYGANPPCWLDVIVRLLAPYQPVAPQPK